MTVLDHSCARLVSSVEQTLEHKTKGRGFKSHVRLTLYIEHILCMIIYDVYIYIKIDIIEYIHILSYMIYMIYIYI